jgi:hypothetical protein
VYTYTYAYNGAVPRVTLYVKDTDLVVWDRARDLAAERRESLSALVLIALELITGPPDAPARLPDTMTHTEVTGWDWHQRTRRRTVHFIGTMVAAVGAITAYLTRGGRIVLVEWALLDERFVAVFESFASLQADPLADALTSELLVDLAAAVGTQYVETLE